MHIAMKSLVFKFGTCISYDSSKWTLNHTVLLMKYSVMVLKTSDTYTGGYTGVYLSNNDMKIQSETDTDVNCYNVQN